MSVSSFFFFFNDTATTEIYTLSLHDALPISGRVLPSLVLGRVDQPDHPLDQIGVVPARSEEHTSELQSQSNLVCRLLLEKKKKKQRITATFICRTRWTTTTRLGCSGHCARAA